MYIFIKYVLATQVSSLSLSSQLAGERRDGDNVRARTMNRRFFFLKKYETIPGIARNSFVCVGIPVDNPNLKLNCGQSKAN